MDGTVGGGGHARALLDRYPDCRILAVDRDPAALEESRSALAPWADRVRFFEGRFDEAARHAGTDGPTLSGALLDLGVSTRQLDADERGFTFRPDAPLDMRMSGSIHGTPTAADVLNGASESELTRIFRDHGEMPRAHRLARAVVLLRGDRPFEVADHFSEAIAKASGRPAGPKEKAPAFQALRIEVNGEMESLDEALPLLKEALLPSGVLAVISYHSLEDRRVKRAFAAWSTACTCPPDFPVGVCGGPSEGAQVNRKVIRPSDDEVGRNPRARSARLRGWRKAA
jgi:16S rRNA (cytosine1402-N4)-methyltransferase